MAMAYNRLICSGADACQGDSGGPASLVKEGRHTQVHPGTPDTTRCTWVYLGTPRYTWHTQVRWISNQKHFHCRKHYEAPLYWAIGVWPNTNFCWFKKMILSHSISCSFATVCAQKSLWIIDTIFFRLVLWALGRVAGTRDIRRSTRGSAHLWPGSKTPLQDILFGTATVKKLQNKY